MYSLTEQSGAITLTEGQQIQLFMTGLGEPLRIDVTLKQSRSLNAPIMLARAYEQRIGVAAPSSKAPSQATSKQWSTPAPTATSMGSVHVIDGHQEILVG
jgi:hypothetical protein